jgi:hypothetical protein
VKPCRPIALEAGSKSIEEGARDVEFATGRTDIAEHLSATKHEEPRVSERFSQVPVW